MPAGLASNHVRPTVEDGDDILGSGARRVARMTGGPVGGPGLGQAEPGRETKEIFRDWFIKLLLHHLFSFFVFLFLLFIVLFRFRWRQRRWRRLRHLAVIGSLICSDFYSY